MENPPTHLKRRILPSSLGRRYSLGHPLDPGLASLSHLLLQKLELKLHPSLLLLLKAQEKWVLAPRRALASRSATKEPDQRGGELV